MSPCFHPHPVPVSLKVTKRCCARKESCPEKMGQWRVSIFTLLFVQSYAAHLNFLCKSQFALATNTELQQSGSSSVALDAQDHITSHIAQKGSFWGTAGPAANPSFLCILQWMKDGRWRMKLVFQSDVFTS